MSFPSVSRKRTNSPTVGISDFGMITFPPFAVTRAAWHPHSRPKMWPRCRSVGSASAGPSVCASDREHRAIPHRRYGSSKSPAAPRVQIPIRIPLHRKCGAVYIIDMDGECGEIAWHGYDDTAVCLVPQSRYSDIVCRKKRRSVADEAYWVVRTFSR